MPSRPCGGADGARCGAGTAPARTARSGGCRSPTSTACPAIRRISRRCWQPGEMITGYRRPGQRGGAQLALPQGARSRELRVRAGVRRRGAGYRATARCVTFASRPAVSAREPWRLPEVEAALRGKRTDDATLHDAVGARRRGRTAGDAERLQADPVAARGAARAADGFGLTEAPMANIGQADRSGRRPPEGDRTARIRGGIRCPGRCARGAGAKHDRRRRDHRLRPCGSAGDAGRAGDHHAATMRRNCR